MEWLPIGGRMIAIEARSIPHVQQRYGDVGDWTVDAHGTRHIRASEMGNSDYEFLVILHEMIEQHLCLARGVTQETVDAFDMGYVGDDPGADRQAPYHREHRFALAIERGVAKALGIDWRKYEEELQKCGC